MTLDHTTLRKISYGILMAPALAINALVILLASYATYIYAAIVILIGLLLINTKRIGMFVKKCGGFRGHNESSSSLSLDKTLV